MARRKPSCLELESYTRTSGEHESGQSSSPRRWYRDIRDLLLSTVEQCKKGVSYVCPSASRCSMSCEVYLEQIHGSEEDYMITVALLRSDHQNDSSRQCRSQTSRIKVGESRFSKLILPGALRTRLLLNKEHRIKDALIKEDSFSGNDFEEKFKCSLKGTPEGASHVIGTAIVEEINDKRETNLVFQLELSQSVEHVSVVSSQSRRDEESKSSVSVPPPDPSWSVKAIRQLAAALHLCDDDNWRCLAKQLGFTEAEIESKIEKTVEPFEAMLDAYRVRGGTPEEFAEAVCSLAGRMRLSDWSPASKSLSGMCNHNVCRQSKAVRRLQFAATPPVAPLAVRIDEHALSDMDNAELQYHVQRTTGACLQMAPLPVYLPLTPPPTPRKRTLSSSSASTSSSESGPSSPSKRMRPSVFLFPDETIDDEEDDDHRSCEERVTTSVMWQLSQQLTHQWKSLARTLNIPENEIICIEHEHKELRECAYQALLKWQQIFPEACVLGKLYTALCECGLRAMAVKYSTMPKEQVCN